MAKESFVLVSLKEDTAKELSQVLASKTCKQILDYLGEKEGTETEIATTLNIPLSTVHYNLQLLKKAKLVSVEEFHYSKKGKEINHYKLENKFIVIAPRTSDTLREILTKKLKNILPLAGVAVVSAFIVRWVTTPRASFLMAESSFDGVQKAASPSIAYETAGLSLAPEPISAVAWFIIGAVVVILTSFLWSIWKR